MPREAGVNGNTRNSRHGKREKSEETGDGETASEPSRQCIRGSRELFFSPIYLTNPHRVRTDSEGSRGVDYEDVALFSDREKSVSH